MSALELTREQARDLAREELSRREYSDAQPPAFQRLIGRATRWLGDRLDDVDGLTLGSPLLARVAVIGALVLIAVLVLVRLAPTAPRRRKQALFDGLSTLSTAEHRAAADAHAAQGRYAEAVRERLRAVARELEERGVIDARPGRTAGEIAQDAGAAVPALAGALDEGARTFGEVWYGDRTATAAEDQVMRQVDAAVLSARTVSA